MTGNARSSCFRAFSEFCREALRGPAPLSSFFQRLASSFFASSFPFPRKNRAYKGHWPDSHAEDPRPSSSRPNENPAFSRKKLLNFEEKVFGSIWFSSRRFCLGCLRATKESPWSFDRTKPHPESINRRKRKSKERRKAGTSRLVEKVPVGTGKRVSSRFHGSWKTYAGSHARTTREQYDKSERRRGHFGRWCFARLEADVFLRNSRERSLLGTFSPSSACLSEKERDSDAAECRFSPGCCCFLSVSLAIVKRGNPAFTAFASEIILARESNKKSLQEFRFWTVRFVQFRRKRFRTYSVCRVAIL